MMCFDVIRYTLLYCTEIVLYLADLVSIYSIHAAARRRGVGGGGGPVCPVLGLVLPTNAIKRYYRRSNATLAYQVMP
jgi:hypothetical protein